MVVLASSNESPSANQPTNQFMKPTTLKPIVILPEILGLKDTKLSEKLLLAIYCAAPATSRARRAISMTRAGLCKLEQRLIQKGRLTVIGDRHAVHVPGFEYVSHPDGGYFVAATSASKNENKIARRVSQKPQTDITPLKVPAELLDFKYLLASEKVLLAFYLTNPTASNECVLAALGISESGLKKLKHELRNKKVLVPSDNGYVIRLPGYVMAKDSQGGHFVPDSEAVKSGYEVTLPAPKLTPARDILKSWASAIKNLTSGSGTGAAPSYLLSLTGKSIKQIEVESPEGPEREAALAMMRESENFLFAKNMIKKSEAEAIEWVHNSTAEQLVDFRVSMEGKMLARMPEQKLLGMIADTISQ